MIIFVFIIFSLIGFFQFPGLIQKKDWPELVVSGGLLLMDFILFGLMVLGFRLPYISDAIGQGVTHIFNLK